ncbi:hypothetical protein E4U59_005835 [Claviceps monticola]|nr:hypothetical protein E4U59_005835 [Claviceps monticola]
MGTSTPRPDAAHNRDDDPLILIKEQEEAGRDSWLGFLSHRRAPTLLGRALNQQRNEALQNALSALSQRLRFVAEGDVFRLRSLLFQRRLIALRLESFGHGTSRWIPTQRDSNKVAPAQFRRNEDEIRAEGSERAAELRS